MSEEKANRAIGIFDSGIGGLTVLHSIMEVLPHENTVYVGDTARVPYGTKSARTVTQYSLEIAKFLEKNEVKALVVACNTASSVALDTLKEQFPLPVIGMIESAARKAVEATISGKIGIIGTEGTVRSGAYEGAIKGLDKGLSVFSKACPLFVPLAEEGWVSNEIARLTAKRYLADMVESGIDTLILGCTHYPLLKETIRSVVAEDIVLVDSGHEAALQLRALLESRGECKEKDSAKRSYFVTDTPERFLRLGDRFLGEGIQSVEHVDIP